MNLVGLRVRKERGLSSFSIGETKDDTLLVQHPQYAKRRRRDN